jgi:hypothetical protein
MSTFNFPPTSRYFGLEVTSLTTHEGEVIAYLRRRFVPSPERFALLREHVVTEGERLDQIAGREIGDPEAFWRVCDSNAAMRPDALTEAIGRRLRITLPEGIPGSPTF